jgi:hypothetical protein
MELLSHIREILSSTLSKEWLKDCQLSRYTHRARLVSLINCTPLKFALLLSQLEDATQLSLSQSNGCPPLELMSANLYYFFSRLS